VSSPSTLQRSRDLGGIGRRFIDLGGSTVRSASWMNEQPSPLGKKAIYMGRQSVLTVVEIFCVVPLVPAIGRLQLLEPVA
jgi:hypothetical protein